jgi:hypothetical protein
MERVRNSLSPRGKKMNECPKDINLDFPILEKRCKTCIFRNHKTRKCGYYLWHPGLQKGRDTTNE